MAVATLVLERETLQEKNERREYASAMTADELHNAQIKENYKRLINPDFGMNEVRGRTVAPETKEEVKPASFERVFESAAARVEQRPYLVQNARADAEIFRADSPVNQRRQAVAPKAYAEIDEEDNEDLRPTNTTIQYRTVEENNAVETKVTSSKTTAIGKREKIIIATFISVVVALFILVIVNSAVIAGLNNELYAIQDGISTARGALAGVNAQIDAATSFEKVAEFAATHGLILE